MTRWVEVPLEKMELDPVMFRQEDLPSRARLLASVRRFGQLRPVVVEETGTGFAVVDGRLLVDVLRQIDPAGSAMAVVLQPGTDRLQLRLALLACAPVDYAAVAMAVGQADGDGDQARSEVGPFDVVRQRHFRTLASFDWSQFSKTDDTQHALDWSREHEADGDLSAFMPAAPADPGAGEVVPSQADLQDTLF